MFSLEYISKITFFRYIYTKAEEGCTYSLKVLKFAQSDKKILVIKWVFEDFFKEIR